LFLEYEAVLKRPEHLAPAGATSGTVDAALAALATLIEPVSPSLKLRPTLGDPDDDMVLEAVVNGAADALVTFETRTFHEAGRHYGFDVLTPSHAWIMLRR